MLRNIIIMVVAVAVIAAAFIIVPKLKPAAVEEVSTEPTPDNSELFLSRLTVDDVDRVILENDGVETILIYDEETGTYMAEGHEERTLNQSTVRNIFYTAAYVEAEGIAAEDLSDVAQFGLDDPVSKVTAEYKDGTSSVFYFGNNVPGSGQHYMIKEGVDKIFMVWNNYGNNARLKLNDLIEIEKQEFALEDLKVIRLHKDGEVYMEFTNMSDRDTLVDMGTWKLTQPYYRSLSSSNSDDAFYSMTEDILNLDPDDILDSQGAPDAYGLDEPSIVIDLVPFNGEPLTISLGDKTDGKYSMKFSDSDIIYEITENEFYFMDYKPIDLVERLLTLVNIKYVAKIETTGIAGDNTVVVTNAEKKDEEGNLKLDGNGNPVIDTGYIVEGVTLTDDEEEQGSWYYQTILSAKITREADKDFVPGKLAGSIKLTLNTDPGEFLIQFYEYDDYFYAVKFDNNDMLLIVNKKDIEKIPASYELLVKREMERP